MTEAEWLACSDPTPMPEYLADKVSARKMRLFACACCRHSWNWSGANNRVAIEVAERFADGEATTEELLAAYEIPGLSQFPTNPDAVVGGIGAAAFIPNSLTNYVSIEQVEAVFCAECHAQIQFIYDIFGNPFRPVTLHPAWLTPKVKTLAQAIYDNRAFERMPELADALVEAGCSNEDILSHCRGPGPHVRGCWVVDLVLGKE
jgi:hypothetical protein